MFYSVKAVTENGSTAEAKKPSADKAEKDTKGKSAKK